METIDIKLGNIEIRPYKDFLNKTVSTNTTYIKYEVIKWLKKMDAPDNYCIVVSFVEGDNPADLIIRTFGTRYCELTENEMKLYNSVIKMLFDYIHTLDVPEE